MKTIYKLRKAFLSALTVLTFISVQGQTIQSGPVHVEGQQTTFDMRNIVWSDVVKKLPEGVALSRGEGLGVKWIERILNLPDYLTTFYQDYGQKVSEVLNGNSNWLSDPSLGDVTGNKRYTLIKTFTGTIDFTFEPGASKDIIKQSAANAVSPVFGNNWNEANGFMYYLSLCLNYDYPEAFWTGNQTQWGCSNSYSYSYYPSSGTGIVEYSQDIYFTLSDSYDDFDYRIEGFQTQQLISDAVTEFNSKVQSIASTYSSGSCYEKVAGLNDWLTLHNSYNAALLRDEEHVNEIAWSPMSALRGSTGDLGPVCEGYARAFKVLCDKAGIPCVLATGDARGYKGGAEEAHMWNEVQMEDGKWYAVDATWNDPTVGGTEADPAESGYENHNWLLLGKNDEVGEDFTFAESHPVTEPYDENNMWQLSFGSLIADQGYQVFPVTDVNRDGNVDDSDLAIIVACIMGTDTDHLGQANINGDEKVNAADVVMWVKLKTTPE